ncbi:MAG: phytanoyl-CoA dioxygenase family protein [Chloroflexota bacterium]
MNQADRDFFAQNGYLNLGQILDETEVTYFRDLFDADQKTYRYFWHAYGHHQYVNYDALITTPKFDELIRHPKILPTIEALMGGPVCFGEIGLRQMGAYDGEFHQAWHRDKPHWPEHPLRMDYIQLMVYMTDVSEDTHCFSISPEAYDQEILLAHDAQFERGGVHDLHGPAGTCALFNVSVLHTATTRPTQVTRKTAQIYYGHRDRAPLANDSGIPATLWRDHDDEETRAFYGVLNERTKIYMAAFG